MSDLSNSSTPDPSTPEGVPLPPDLRFLKLLVTALAATMIIGLITIIVLIVIKVPEVAGGAPALPDNITLPAGSTAQAVTIGRGWYGVVSDAPAFLIYDAKSGKLIQQVVITLPTE